MKKSVIAAICLSPFLWGCQGQDSAKYSTDWGNVDARELAKECIYLLKNNPKKFDINAKYQFLCGDPKNKFSSDGGEANQVVYGFMQLLRKVTTFLPFRLNRRSVENQFNLQAMMLRVVGRNPDLLATK